MPTSTAREGEAVHARVGDVAPTRERAPRMSPEARRAAIVEAALPLVTRFGSGVLTADIAAAAGIAEGTIFRVFADKDALLGACLAAVADTSDVRRRLDTLQDEPLEVAVEGAIEIVLGHLAAAMPVVMRVTTTGPTPRTAIGLRAQLTNETREELADVLRVYSDQLAIPVEEAAGILHVLVLGAAVQSDGPSAAVLAQAFVSGVGS